MFADKNSKAASDYAEKRKAQLDRAAELKQARDRSQYAKSIRSLDNSTAIHDEGAFSLDELQMSSKIKDEGSVVPNSTKPSYSSRQKLGKGAIVSAGGIRSLKKYDCDSKTTNPTDSTKYGDKISPSSSTFQSGTISKARTLSGTSPSKDIVQKSIKPAINADIYTYNDLNGSTVAERIVIRPNVTPSTTMKSLSSEGPRKPIQSSISNYLRPPKDIEGRRVDISDRPIMCSATNGTNEVVVGGSDHLLYSVDVNDRRKAPIRMSGHNDWVTSIAFLCDNRVISASMDGNLLLWNNSRRKSSQMANGHSKSISKVIASPDQLLAISVSYDGKLAVWSFSEDTDGSTTRATVRQRAVNARDSQISPIAIIPGIGNEPLVECALNGIIGCFADRSGRIMAWDLSQSANVANIRAHQGPISSLHYPTSHGDMGSNILISGGVDGYTKVWDLRSNEHNGLVCKIMTHYGSTSRDSSVQKGSAVTSISMIDYQGSGSLSYIISGGADSAVVIQDIRRNGDIVQRWDGHCKNGIYSMAIAEWDKSVFVGDGAGMVMCYDICNGELKYGLGASETGAVSTMQICSNMLVTGGEDGKMLLYDYS